MRRTHLIWAGPLIVLVLVAALLLLPLPWAHTTYIHTEVEIKRSPSEVFAYVTTPGNWPRWHPSSLAVRGKTDHPLSLGEQVTEDFVVAGRRGSVLWTVIAHQAERHWAIKGKVEGGGQGVVSYTITPTASGSRFERNFQYTFRTLLLIALDQVEIRGRVEQESSEALQRLRIILDEPTAAPFQQLPPPVDGSSPRADVPWRAIGELLNEAPSEVSERAANAPVCA